MQLQLARFDLIRNQRELKTLLTIRVVRLEDKAREEIVSNFSLNFSVVMNFQPCRKTVPR